MSPSLIQSAKMRIYDAYLRFRKGTEGVMAVEMIIMLPFLFWMIATSFELYEVHRYKSVRIKATYTVADMFSRENLQADDALLDSAAAVFNDQTMDNGTNQIRVSLIRYSGPADEFEVIWSELRGTGPMPQLTTADVATAHDTIPILDGGEEILLVESTSEYRPHFVYPGLNNGYTVNTKIFTGIRFIGRLCWECEFSV